jgi:mitochondrial cardiolipin hydrolase
MLRQVEYLESPVAYAKKILLPNSCPSGQPITPTAPLSIKKALFSPDDDIKTVLLGLIASERQAISAALYMLTEKEIVQALIEAHKRGVKIELVTDLSCVESRFCKIDFLVREGIPVYVYHPALQTKNSSDSKSRSLMHNKFFIFNDTLDHKQILSTGSYNATKAAGVSNQENMIFTDDPDVIAAFKAQFIKLKQRSRFY